MVRIINKSSSLRPGVPPEGSRAHPALNALCASKRGSYRRGKQAADE